MKKLLSIVALCLFTVALCAQDRVVTKFLGIPVDGTKAEMISKLKAKGFTSSAYEADILEGEFNGVNVNVYIATNNNKVYRIMVADKSYRDEADIKIRYNKLCSQFENNIKYRKSAQEQSLSAEEKIRNGISLYNKRYEAIFYQKSSWNAEESTSDFMRPVWFIIDKESYDSKYGILMYYDNEYNKANGDDL